MASQKNKLTEIPHRLKQFTIRDVRNNPILGLYLVIGVMVVCYCIYFIVVLYQDISGDGKKRVASKPRVEQVKKRTPPKNKAATSKKKVAAAKKEAAVAMKKVAAAMKNDSPDKTKPGQHKSEVVKLAATNTSETGRKLDQSKWKSIEFPDGSYISIPREWTRSEVDSEKNILHGIRLHVPGSEASLKCYSRSRRLGDNYSEHLTETLERQGYTRIEEETKKIKQRDVVQISGTLADTSMVVVVFDDKPDKYFIVRMIASKQEFAELQSYYNAIVESYGDDSSRDTSVLSIEKLEKQLEQSIKDDKEFVVGSTVWIKMKNGARHKGVVIAENDTSLTLESFRFGGRYSFSVKKDDIVEIVR